MQKVVEDILAGEFTYTSGSLEFSCPKLEITLLPGEQAEGSFFIEGEAEKEPEGFVMATGIRMECLTRQFKGRLVEIFYRFDSKGMEAGEVLKGEFKVISAQGEYSLAYVVMVMQKPIVTTLGNIKNLFHFTNLAKTNWEEAVRLFYSPAFLRIFEENDSQYLNTYRGLSASYGSEQQVEEFLLEINKKQIVEYIPQKESITLTASQGVTEEILALDRDGWGYTRLTVEIDGEFLTGEKEALTDDDFLGNVCRYRLYIDNSLLHAGKNMGMVHIFNEYVSMEIPVTVDKSPALPMRSRRGKREKILELMRFYLNFRMERITEAKWLEETEAVIREMQEADGKDAAARLFQAQLLVTKERYNEAKWILDRIENKIPREGTNPELWSYYLYLTTLCNRQESYVSLITGEVRRIHRENPTNWKVAWLLLYLDEEYSRSPSRKWLFLEQQFVGGCTSPVWYMEAVHLVQAAPTLLMKLGPFAVQVLNFAAKYGLLTDEIIGQIHYMADRIRGYSQRMADILQACYETKRDDESLRVLCTLLIKGNRTGERYVRWYRDAIERELRITRLYEYYMMSVNREKEEKIPRMALMYFAYQSNLDYERTAYLYAYLQRRREEYPELYAAYRRDMELFTARQLEKGRINEDLALLYRELCSESMLNSENACHYAEFLFMNRVKIKDERIRRVVVVYGKLREEKVYPVSQGKAYVPVYVNDCRLLLEDKDKNRYSHSVPYVMEKLMLPGRRIKLLGELVKGHVGYGLYMCESGRNYTVVTEENADLVREVMDSEEVISRYRHELCMKLARYYFEHDLGKWLDEFLPSMDPEGMSSKERSEIMRYMVIRGMYDTALSWVERYGVHEMEPKTLVRLCSRILVQRQFREDRRLTEVIYYAFRRGKYDENILRYLCMYFVGLTREMRDVWKASDGFDVDHYELCERMLVQMLYTGAYVGEEITIFRQYVNGGARMELIRAYLSHCAYAYFVKGRVTEEYIFVQLQRLGRSGEGMNTVCSLALLKYFSEKAGCPSSSDRELIESLLEGMALEKRIYFSFFRELSEYCPALSALRDKTILEYRTKPGTRVILHYMTERQGEDETHYRTEEMRNMYGGIYVKSFLLFFGENLQYYITEEKSGKERLVESGTLSKSDTGRVESGGRFSLANDIATGCALQDYETSDQLLEEYLHMDFMVENLFGLL